MIFVQPVPFIIGSPRSGTTLLRLMLDAHPELAIPYETHFFMKAWYEVRLPIVDKVLFYLQMMRRTRYSWQDFGLEKSDFLAELQKIPNFSVPNGLRVFFRLYAQKFGKMRWGEKTPSHALSMPLIRRYFKEARFIHIIRDGRDCVVSLGNRTRNTLPFEARVNFWKNAVIQARLDGLGHSDYLEIRYEDLINEPQRELEKICWHIELPFSQAMLQHHLYATERMAELKGIYIKKNKTYRSAEESRLPHENSVRAPDKDLIGMWKKSLNPTEQQLFLVLAGELLVELGYDPSIVVPLLEPDNAKGAS